MLAYLAKVRAEYAEKLRLEQEEAERCRREGPPLDRAIKRWFAMLTPDQQRQRFYLTDLCTKFGTRPAEMGLALRRLGWMRKREWTTASNRRYWVMTE
jgi:hypothetical protein